MTAVAAVGNPTARAATSTPLRARLVYAVADEARAHCPTTPTLRAEIAERVGRDAFWEWAPRTIVVQFEGTPEKGYTGRVIQVHADGTSAARELPRLDDCHELASAAALTVSIALDSFARDTPTAADKGPPTEPPPAPQAPPPVARRSEAPAPPPTPPPPSPRGATGIAATATTGVAPDPSFGLTAFGELRTSFGFVGAELEGSLSKPANDLEVGAVALAMAPCLRFGPAFACALAKVGWVEAWGLGGAGGQDGAPFVSLGGRLGAEVRPEPGWFLRLYGDVAIEAYGPRFIAPAPAYNGGGIVFVERRASPEPSIVGGTLGIGIGADFR